MFIALGSLILGHAAEAQGKYVRILLTNGKTIEFTLNQKPVIKYGTATVTAHPINHGDNSLVL